MLITHKMGQILSTLRECFKSSGIILKSSHHSMLSPKHCLSAPPPWNSCKVNHIVAPGSIFYISTYTCLTLKAEQSHKITQENWQNIHYLSIQKKYHCFHLNKHIFILCTWVDDFLHFFLKATQIIKTLKKADTIFISARTWYFFLFANLPSHPTFYQFNFKTCIKI